MNILMVAQFAAPIIGGEEQHITNLSQELVRRGHQVSVATIKHPDQADFEVIDGVRIHRLRGTAQRLKLLYSADVRRHAPPFPDPEITLGIRRLVKLENPDIVHAHNWLVYSYLPLAPKSKAGLVVTLHDYSLQCAIKRFMYKGSPCSGPGLVKCLGCAGDHYGPIKGGSIYLSNRLMGHLERSSVDMYLAVSQVTATNNGLVDSGLPYQVIPNFLPDETGLPGEEQDLLLSQLPEGEFLLFVGDLATEKGLGILLQAYAGLTGVPPLVLIGRPISDTPRQLPPNVIMLGSWPHSAVMQAMRRSTIALAPSLWVEPFGMVVIEAMSAGRPLIASRIGGIADILTHGETGLLVNPGDAQALKEAIQLLLSKPELREQLGKNARRRSADYRANVIIPRIEQVYRSIMDEKRSQVSHGQV